MYDLVVKLVPLLDKWSFVLSVILFAYWLFQSKTKIYQLHLQNKARRDYSKQWANVLEFNLANPNSKVQINSYWTDLYKAYTARTGNTLLLSLVFAYISFNTTSFHRNNNEDFFKFLTISTTLFLAGITYIQQKYRE